MKHLFLAAALLAVPLSTYEIAMPHPATAAESVVAQRRAQAPGFYQFRLGDFQITTLSDGTVPQDLYKLLIGTDQQEIDTLLKRDFVQNPIEISINALVIDTGSKLVLVDTGAGQLFGPGYGGKVVSSLNAAGYEPENITDILITHIHTDHTGGLVSGGNLVFPNAVVHVGKPDVDFFMNPENIKKSGYDKKYFDEAALTVGPSQKAGKLQPFEGRAEILPGITAIPTPGHTPGHAFYLVESKGQQIEFCGDIAHIAPVQFPKPAVTIVYDVDTKKAASQRADQFKDQAEQARLVAFAHMPYPGIGHVRKDGDGYLWVPIVYRDRSGN